MSAKVTVTITGEVTASAYDEEHLTLRNLVLRYPEYLDVPISYWVSDDRNGYEQIDSGGSWVDRYRAEDRADGSTDPGMFRIKVNLNNRRLVRKPARKTK